MKDLEDIIKEWSDEVIEKIKFNLDSTGTTASGETKRSLEMVWINNGFQIVGRPYFRGVEEGRPGGGIPRNFTNILYDWAEAKGILSKFGTEESEQRSALFLVGQFIKHHGTQLYIKGGREDIYSNVINEELPKLMEMIEGRVEETIIKELNIN